MDFDLAPTSSRSLPASAVTTPGRPQTQKTPQRTKRKVVTSRDEGEAEHVLNLDTGFLYAQADSYLEVNAPVNSWSDQGEFWMENRRARVPDGTYEQKDVSSKTVDEKLILVTVSKKKKNRDL